MQQVRFYFCIAVIDMTSNFVGFDFACKNMNSRYILVELTGKSFSEAALILASTNPQYDKRLFIDLPIQYMKTISSEQVVYINCFLF